MADNMVWPVRYRTASTVRSHFGRAVVAGVVVEIMGVIEKQRPDGTWMPAADLASMIEWIAWEGRTWPVLPVAYEAAAYRALGRHAMADRLDRWLALRPHF